MPVIGFLSPESDNSKIVTVPFLQGLKETGYVEGQNVAVAGRKINSIGCRRSQPI